jgi:Fur family peroxide stress response transcriptional regulator
VTLPDQLAAFKRLCQQHGLPLTVQRQAILETLASHKGHPTADEIFAEVRPRLPGVSRTTVYRVLETLVHVGVARKVCHPGATVRYETKTTRHHHLVCLYCNRLTDVEETSLNSLPFPDVGRLGFQIEDYSVQFRGICRACARKLSARRRGKGPQGPRRRGGLSQNKPSKGERR